MSHVFAFIGANTILVLGAVSALAAAFVLIGWGQGAAFALMLWGGIVMAKAGVGQPPEVAEEE